MTRRLLPWLLPFFMTQEPTDPPAPEPPCIAWECSGDMCGRWVDCECVARDEGGLEL